ncbi:coiled-coil domain-containing protein 174-like isoform X2 [Acanthaster planci]|uniref:Coiled-coil domain-containing protein 174-like isoform X2 n=1 Tax=Acanthaster planci TaxID=133434 RepID=A0A8B7XQ31_ACAPL|nr:coiled-coil domain-containing protein 174-like isoform X2 [Acanthaster planci]
MNAKKKIEVNSSSLVGLKAELFRKQEALRKEKLQQGSTTIKSKPVPKKPSIWSKKNAGVQSRAEKDKSLTVEEENQLDKSRAALEAKTRLYEQMSQRSVLSADDEVSDRFLVDFEKKAIDELHEEKIYQQEKSEETEYEMGATDVPGPVDPEDEWVDYVDTLGRSRRCMKKDLPELINMDKRLNPQAFKDAEEKTTSEEPLPDLLSSDMYREMMRKKWEEEEEEMRRRGPGSVHYQNVRFDEVREMGVGYFDFSKDESERQKQMEMLKHLRDETLDQRSKSEQLKAKRKAALKARLEKVKQRKRLKGELVEDEEEQKDEEREEREEGEEVQQEEDVRQIAERLKAAPIRPWDIGKESQWERVKRQVRAERPQEFAPPSCYYDGTAPAAKANPNTLRNNPQSKRLQEFAPPTDYGKRMYKDGGVHSWDWNCLGGEATTSGRMPRKDATNKSEHGTVDGKSIAQALSFFRQNMK